MAKQVVRVSGQHLLAINGATYVPSTNAVISVSDDKFDARRGQAAHVQFGPTRLRSTTELPWPDAPHLSWP